MKCDLMTVIIICKASLFVDKIIRLHLLAPGKQGRYDGELLLREDQLLSGIWKQKVIKIRKDIKSAFGEDVTSDVGLYINKSTDIRIGLGKQNPNARKGRERRGKKKSGNRT